MIDEALSWETILNPQTRECKGGRVHWCGGGWAAPAVNKKKRDSIDSAERQRLILAALLEIGGWVKGDRIAAAIGSYPAVVGRQLKYMAVRGLVIQSAKRTAAAGDGKGKKLFSWSLP